MYHGGYFGMAKDEIEERAEEMIEVFGLDPKRDVRAPKLSGGQRRRLLLARALMHRPRLVILDEPTAGVDFELRLELWRYIRRLHAEGTTILLTTHYLEEAEVLCEEIALIRDGRLIARDSADGLREHFGVEPAGGRLREGHGVVTGLVWLCKRETLRVSKLWTQTVLAPVVSSILFILVFGLSLGGRIKQVGDVDYEVFIVPGLITMGMVQAAFANNASTIFQARFDRYINDVLSAPMRPWQMTLGYTVGGIFRALAIGVSLLVLAILLVDVPVERPFALARRSRSGWCCSRRSALVVGIYAETWDHTTFIANIVILPLAFVGGVFYSVDVLPSPWHELSHFNPVFYLVNGVRYGFLGESDVSVWLSLGVTAALAIPAYPWAQWLFTTGKRLKRSRAGRALPALPAPRGVARARGAREARRVRRRGLLGPARAGLRRSRARACRARAGAGGARRQPHRARVHGRPLGRLAVRVDAPHRLRQPANRVTRRRTGAARRVDRGRGALRAARPTSRCRRSATTACPTRAGAAAARSPR